MTITPVIMCGGSGTRMWPVSRETLPKQFIRLIGARSTFQNTMITLARSDTFDRPVVLTNHDYRFLVAEQLEEIGLEADIVIEPVRRDSGPAVAVAAELAARRSPETVVAVLAADHHVTDPNRLASLWARAGEAAASGLIVTLGIAPAYPATGYGYIRPGSAASGPEDVRKVEAFVEKPDAETASRYIAEGYLWNSGNFIFRADTMCGEIAAFAPAIADAARHAVAASRKDLDFTVLDRESFEAAPKISIDYAVMEKTARSAVIPADVGWSDVGTWEAVRDLLKESGNADDAGNIVDGDGIVMNASNTMVRSEDLFTAVVGVNDAIVVSTVDAVLVLNAKDAGKVKDLVEQLKKDGRIEPVEHRRIYRPWGHYQGVDSGDRYQVKRITVKPGGQLSLQKHHHRAEHWIVVKGTAEVTRDNEVLHVHENSSIYLPIGCVHRLANPGKIPLELIEVQTGSYLGEDDIVRMEDIYNRN